MPHSGVPKARGLTAKAPTERSSLLPRCASSSDTVREIEHPEKEVHQQEVKQATNAVRDAMRATQRLAKDIEAAKTALANEIEAPSSLKSTLVGEARERAYARGGRSSRSRRRVRRATAHAPTSGRH